MRVIKVATSSPIQVRRSFTFRYRWGGVEQLRVRSLQEITLKLKIKLLETSTSYPIQVRREFQKLSDS